MDRPKSGKDHTTTLSFRIGGKDRRHLNWLAATHADGNSGVLLRRVLRCFLDANPASKWALKAQTPMTQAKADRLAEML